MLNKTNTKQGESMITLEIKRKNDRACHLNGEHEIKSFHNVKELTDYFMSEFSRWYSYNRFYWETSAKQWFSYKKGFCDNDTVYCFGGEFTIKLIKERA